MSATGRSYEIRRPSARPSLNGAVAGSAWAEAAVAEVAAFHARSTEHRPRTEVRLLHDERGLYVRFDVDDRYVRCVHDGHQQAVCRDSCVEWFVQPKADCGYFNFETNCGGAILLSYIEDHRPAPEGGFRACTRVADHWIERIDLHHTMPGIVEPEVADDVHWTNAYFVPRELLEAYVGPLGELSGQTWRGNFYKCGDQTSHPHWASWAPIGRRLSFHRPEYFAEMRLV